MKTTRIVLSVIMVALVIIIIILDRASISLLKDQCEVKEVALQQLQWQTLKWQTAAKVVLVKRGVVDKQVRPEELLPEKLVEWLEPRPTPYYKIDYSDDNSKMFIHLDRPFINSRPGTPVAECLPLDKDGKVPEAVNRLFAIKGIQEVDLLFYKIVLEKADVYKWSDLLDKVTKVLDSELNPNKPPI